MAVFKPGQGTDDCMIWGTTINLDSSLVRLGSFFGMGHNTGLRFVGVNIPKGATILTAIVTFQSYNTESGPTCNVQIKGEDIDDAETFSTKANFDGRTRTAAYKNWDAIDAWTENADYDSPDISNIIKAIIDRSEWVSGNHLALFFANNASSTGAKRDPKTYDLSTTLCARLTVTWSETVDVTVDVGLQSGSKSLFSVSENTDQVLSQNLLSKSGSLFSPSENTDQILSQDLPLALGGVLAPSENTDQVLDQILQTGSKTIFSVSNVTDQVLSQNLLQVVLSILSALISIDVETGVGFQTGTQTVLHPSNITDQVLDQNLLQSAVSILSALASTDQILSVNIVLGVGSPQVVTVEIVTGGVVVSLSLLITTGSVLGLSLQTDQILQLNALSALASIYQILIQIKAAPENFKYQNLKLELPPALPEGDFAYEHSSLKTPDQQPEGSFAYQRLRLKKVTEE